ncbi:MAG TPA: paraslipin [Alphaproteobacteria bacterium]|nr:paraslipin [Alphaproteobacteria bacterium]
MHDANIFYIAIFAVIIIAIFKGIKLVPQQQVFVVERLGRFSRTLEGGLYFIVPFIDSVRYKHTLKEDAIEIRSQSAITKDNVTLEIDGVLYLKIIDPKLASYGVENPYFALTQLAQTTMRSEIGKLDLDRTFEERSSLNANIVEALNEASQRWGVQCLRYEIKDINPPQSILKSMEQQVTAERTKRAQILDSEGSRQAKINVAEGDKAEKVLASEGAKIDQINRAEGEAKAIIMVAEATAQGIEKVAQTIQKTGGSDAVALKLAEKYIEAFGKLAQQSTTVLLPSNAGDISGFVAQAMTVFENIKASKTHGVK